MLVSTFLVNGLLENKCMLANYCFNYLIILLVDGHHTNLQYHRPAEQMILRDQSMPIRGRLGWLGAGT